MTTTAVEIDVVPEGPTLAPGAWRGVAPHLAFALLAILLVSSPLLFTDWTNAVDFTNAFWYTSVRAWQIEHSQAASYYIQAYSTGLFTPFFAFYGGGLFTAAGLLSIAVGNHPIAAMEIIGVAAFTSAYGGTYWISRQCGLNRVFSHVPSLVVITSAYWATVIYGRGDWPEFIAISAIPTVIAAGARLLRSDRLQFWPVLAFLPSAFFFVAAHAITLTWGTTLIVLGGIALLLLYRWRIPLIRWVRVAALVLLVVLVDAWALGPLVAYSNDVAIARDSAPLNSTGFLDPFSVVFWPFRKVPPESTTPALFVQASDWFLVWALVLIGAFFFTRRRWAAKKAVLVIGGLFAILTALVLSSDTYRLPSPWKQIQYPYRLDSYMALLTAGLVLVALLALQGARVREKVIGLTTLAAVIVVSVVICIWQLFVPVTEQPVAYAQQGSLATRAAALTGPNQPPESFEAYDDYADKYDPQIFTPSAHFYFALTYLSANQENLSELATLPPGLAPIDTNISAGPEFVTISGGAHRVGDDPQGRAVIERNTPGSGPVTVTITTNKNWMSLLPYVSLAGIVAAFGLLVLLAVRDLSGRKRARAGKASPPEPPTLDPSAA